MIEHRQVESTIEYDTRTRYLPSTRTKHFLRAVLVLFLPGLPLLDERVGVDALSSPQLPLSSSWSKLKQKSSRDLVLLQEWAIQNGVVLADGVGFEQVNADVDDWAIALHQSNNQQGDKNTSKIFKPGSVVLSVPKSLVLSSPDILAEMQGETSLQSAFDVLDKANLGNHHAEFLLFLKILKEVDLGSQSLWYPWLQSLPKRFGTGVGYDEVELNCLPPFSRALADYERMKLQFFGLAATKLALDWMNPQHSDDSDNKTDLYQWAYNVVYSRCWKFSDDLESGISDIVPIGDLFNHREPATISVRNDDNAETVDFVLTEDVAADESFAIDAGLYLSYGLTNPHRFLVIFGFVDQFMPEVFSQIVFPEPTEHHVAFGCADRSKMVYRTKDGAIANAVWDSILYALLAQKPEERTALVKAHSEGDKEAKTALHATYALETALTLKNHVTRTVRELNNLRDKINHAAEEDGSNQHQNLSLIQTHNDFLRNVFGKVEERLDDAIERERMRRRNR